MPMSTRPRRALAASVVGTTLVLSGCGTQSQSRTASGPLTIGFVNGSDTAFHTCLRKAVEEEATAQRVTLYTANSRQDPGTELSNIQDMIARDVDAVIVQTVNVSALEDDIAKAKKAGIPIFLTTFVPEDTADLLGAVVVDLRKVGELDADWVARDAAGRQVEVGVIAGAPGAASDLLTSGFSERLPANAEVVATAPGMFDAAKAESVAANMIQAHPDLRYAFVANEEMAFGVRKAFDAAGAEDVRIVTVNGTDEGLAALKDGRFSATVTNSAMRIGELAVENTVDLLRKYKEVEKITELPIRLITEDNTELAPMYCPSNDY
ncbi:sugar ABC transporter substrate-binding protein [Streptomyces sp. NBC_00243]|uniref:sugar ABC transporter substrate-binding protein n=1 Tax=Streptomyces sp. NBC_00243 TaxID=2975688 RepID=UPI002DD9BAEB|nr:sugar ABC transporter substrate-binding protein [Streptomyces sp. NBC_00243]WRZ19130.1 sugar ABC transporter substrate-binding protein [Streptomyces sp. NBC_00243]